jgi:GNAT superfamily N-acetyltransferase
MFRSFAIDTQEGSIEAYTVSNADENIYNYFLEYNISDEIVSVIKDKKSFEIGLIRNLFVEEEHRGKGIGNVLFQEVIDQMEEETSTDIIFLISDKYEDNSFDLERWYESFGFTSIENTSSGPLMVYGNEDLIEELIQSVPKIKI